MASYEPLPESDEWHELGKVDRLARFVLCYVVWAAYSALAVYGAVLIRETYLGFLPVWGPWVMTGVDRFAVVIVVLALLCYVLFIEHYLRRGVVTSQFRRRALLLAIWQLPITAALFAATYAVPWLILRSAG